MAGRQYPDWMWQMQDVPVISRREIEDLGRYNAEVARGIIHTPQHVERMAELQRRFDFWAPMFTTTAKPRHRRRRLFIWRWHR